MSEAMDAFGVDWWMNETDGTRDQAERLRLASLVRHECPICTCAGDHSGRLHFSRACVFTKATGALLLRQSSGFNALGLHKASPDEASARPSDGPPR